jgi:uncharacterized membrane protein YdjX (TVP38/TMEM64 family)
MNSETTQSGVNAMEAVTVEPEGPSPPHRLTEGAAGDDGNLRLLSPFAFSANEDAELPAELAQTTTCKRCKVRCRPWLRWIGWGMVAMFFISTGVVFMVFQKQLVRAAFRYRSAIVHSGLLGTVLTQIVFLLWVVLLLPTTAFEVLIAFTYGFPVSFAISMVGKTVGSIAVFGVARLFLRERAWKAVTRKRPVRLLFIPASTLHRKLHQKIWLISTRLNMMPRARQQCMRLRPSENEVLSTLLYTAQEHCFWTVSMVRLAYIPLSIKNVGLSAFPVSVTIFSICTFLTNIPYAICYCWLGSSLSGIADSTTGDLSLMRHWQATVALAVGLTFTAVLFLGGIYYTRRLIRVALQARLAALTAQADPRSLCSDVTIDAPLARTKPQPNEKETATASDCEVGGLPVASGAVRSAFARSAAACPAL